MIETVITLSGVIVLLAGALCGVVKQRRNGRDSVDTLTTRAQEAIARVATVEGNLDGINSRLGAIESGQRELTARIDRVLERL